MKRPGKYVWLILAFMIGIGSCGLMYFIGNFLFGDTVHNWFEYIARTYQLQTGEIASTDRLVYFIIFSIIGMTFSPIGEELLYRGVIHKSFANSVGERSASFLDSAAFGLTHLAHFGIIFYAGKWDIVLIPALLWVTLIFGTGLVFHYCKQKSGSILGAIICHAGFNLAMNYFIFYHII